jgi:hypothetical protein
MNCKEYKEAQKKEEGSEKFLLQSHLSVGKTMLVFMTANALSQQLCSLLPATKVS